MGTLSYSLHIDSSSGGTSTIKNKTILRKRLQHNLRSYSEKDMRENVVLLGEPNARAAYKDFENKFKELFDDEVAEYNEQQSRPHRRIDDYMQHVNDNKKTLLATEMIIQVGNKDFWDNYNLDEKKQMTPLFEKQLEKLQKECPNFEMVSAVVHYDESSPHLQIIGIPVSEGYKTGLQKRVSKRDVFNLTTLRELQDSMREDVEMDMKAIYGPDINLQTKEDGRNYSVTPAKYRQLMDTMKQDLKALEIENSSLKQENKSMVEEKNLIIQEKSELIQKKIQENNELMNTKNDLEIEIKRQKKEIQEYKDIIDREVKPTGLLNKRYTQDDLLTLSASYNRRYREKYEEETEEEKQRLQQEYRNKENRLQEQFRNSESKLQEHYKAKESDIVTKFNNFKKSILNQLNAYFNPSMQEIENKVKKVSNSYTPEERETKLLKTYHEHFKSKGYGNIILDEYEPVKKRLEDEQKQEAMDNIKKRHQSIESKIQNMEVKDSLDKDFEI